jgi:hypothetical protein
MQGNTCHFGPVTLDPTETSRKIKEDYSRPALLHTVILMVLNQTLRERKRT